MHFYTLSFSFGWKMNSKVFSSGLTSPPVHYVGWGHASKLVTFSTQVTSLANSPQVPRLYLYFFSSCYYLAPYL